METNTDLKARADKYFKEIGIDPDKKTDNVNFPSPPTAVDTVVDKSKITTEFCTIECITYIVYTYVSVQFQHHVFEGHAFGIGIGGAFNGGVIYFADEKKLLDTKSFGIFYVAADGGVMHVTWGTHGNATVAGVGEGGAAMGGFGKWK